ncbi:AsmA-like C-terminal region-containing protein [Jiella pacifica]|uniref:AsmA-like C-terminal region n=1 Tax=Jiella pacifica TaxID=2696469 RepID=A0A6N9T6C2_9HYPH|nr:AsmA-like C-terminal region-containing protein [Jiella pacifica]NDW05319.1 hypothetical protein [Jiella pacifica]
MRRAAGISCGVLAAVLVFVVGTITLVVATSFGNRLLLDQSERLAAMILPDGVAVSIGGRSVGFAPSGKIGLRYANVVLTDRASGATLGSVADLSIGFSLFDLLTDDLAAEAITADGVIIEPALLSGGADVGPVKVEAIFAGLDRAAAEIVGLPIETITVSNLQLAGSGPAEPRVERLQMSKEAGGDLRLNAAVALDQRRIAVTGSAVPFAAGPGLRELSLSTSRIDVPVTIGPAARPSLAFSLGLSGEKGERRLKLVATTALSDGDGQRIDGVLSIGFNEGLQAADIAADFTDGSDVRAVFEGAVDLAAAADGMVPFRLDSTQLVSSLRSVVAEPGPTLTRTARLTSRGTVDLKAGKLRIQEARLETGDGWLAATAELGGLGAQDRLETRVAAMGLSAADLLAFWPFFLAEGPRSWGMAHLKDGVVTDAQISLDLTIERLLAVIEPNTPMRDDEFKLRLGFEGGAFTTLTDMPPLAEVSGSVRHRGDHATIGLESGSVVGMPELSILPSSLEFQHAGGGVDGALSLNIEGAAADLIRLAGHEPIIANATKDWQPQDFEGKARVGVGTAFHLGDEPEAGADVSGLKWTVVAELKGVDVKKPIEGRRLTDLTGTAMIAEASAMGDFTGRIDGIPADVSFTQPIGPDPVGDASLKISARLDDGEIAALSPSLARVVKGPVAVDLTRQGSGFASRVDLTRAAMTLPAIGWSKSAGVPGILTFSARQDGPVLRIDDAVLDGEGFSATGSAELDDAGLKSMVLNSLALNRSDSVSARLTRIEGGIGISIAANGIDARPMLAAFEAGFGKNGDKQSGDEERLRIELSADKLVGFNGETLQDAAIRYEASGDRVRGASLAASIAGAPVSMIFEPAARDTPALRLEVGDAGALLRFSGFYGKMKGGRLQARLGTRDGAYGGQVVLSDFTLVDEERLRRLVGTAQQRSDSLAARLGKDLPVANAYFDTAYATLLWKGGRLILDDGIIRGPVFGSSFAGTLIDPSGRVDMAGSFMPAYGVNRLFGALPFVGGVLGNGGEGGLIGITYRLDGMLSDPTLIVNPISLIAPGIFRRIFEY